MTEPFPSITLLGTRINLITMDGLHAMFSALVARDGLSVVTYANIHALNLACDLPWYRKFLNEADCTFCDGHGLMLGAKIAGERPIPEKITAAHWTPLFAKYCALHGHSWFLLGSKPGVAAAASDKLQGIAPGLNVVGTHHGYFDKSPTSPENLEVIDRINEAKPDILFVGFGMPHQERWILDNRDQIRARVALTAGATLDYAAGHHKRPPRWLTDNGLEWLGRWWYEPRRLAARYFVGNPLFLARCVRERIRLPGKLEN